MRKSIEEILSNYQIRKTVKQKEKFIEWLKSHADIHGYEVKEEVYGHGIKGKNLIVGDPKMANVLLTAHYDTPPNAFIPITTIIGNVPMYILSQLFVYVQVFFAFVLIHYLMYAIFGEIRFFSDMVPFFWFNVPRLAFVLMILWTIQMIIGIPNKNNANDNTSGISVLLTLLEDLTPKQRDKVCFVFFDEEEKGLEGSKVFRANNKNILLSKPLINFDCVGHGKYLMFITKKVFRESNYNNILEEVVHNKAVVKKAKDYVYASDQFIFKNSVGVAAVHKMPVLGYYMNRLHSRFDTKFDANNIETLNKIMKEFISKIDEKN